MAGDNWSTHDGARAALRVRGLTVAYGGVQALTDLDLAVGEGKLVGLIGPNGAGKTTCIDAITGFTPCSGRVELDGVDISRASPSQRARHGLARTWQGIELFDELTVRENLAVARGRPTARRLALELITGRTRNHAAVDAALDLLGLRSLADELPGVLTQGQRKLVGVARALVSKPRVICLDEPAAGLDTHESQELGRTLREVVRAGTSMLLIDHDMGLVLTYCDEVTVLEFGRTIAQGPPNEVGAIPAVVEAYLGKAGAAVMTEIAEP